MDWYDLNDPNEVDTPALLIYSKRVENNIDRAIQMVSSIDHFRPHVKTNKSIDVAKLMLSKGITKFKCATIAEAEMLALAQAPDVLIAHQPFSPKMKRILQLVNEYPNTVFSTIIDNAESGKSLSEIFQKADKSIVIYIDLDVGMRRTGIAITEAADLVEKLQKLPNTKLAGLHVYDGHLRHSNINERIKACDDCYVPVENFKNAMNQKHGLHLKIVAGGSPTFPVHAKRKDVECSPGTFVYWDHGYGSILSEQPFEPAALVMTRILSKIGSDRICLDLGHKSIASENPFPRVRFLNFENHPQIGHSEEHLIIDVGDNSNYEIGQVLYGVPYHVCPTVAMYDEATVIKNNAPIGKWKTTARGRKITI